MTKAHQRIIREKLQKLHQGDLFGKWWGDVDLTLKNAEVRRIDYLTAKTLILEQEWIGTMPLPKSCRFIYGLYFQGHLGGVEVYVEPSTRQFMKNHPRQVVQLNRGACAFWSPPNSASYLISRTLRILKKEGIRLVIAYCTQEAGEIGTIYQSLGWWYVGNTQPSKVYWLDNHWISERTLADKIKWAENKHQMWKDKFQNLKTKQLEAKLKYVKLLGTKKENQQMCKLYNLKPTPYPKRMLNGEK